MKISGNTPKSTNIQNESSLKANEIEAGTARLALLKGTAQSASAGAAPRAKTTAGANADTTAISRASASASIKANADTTAISRASASASIKANADTTAISRASTSIKANADTTTISRASASIKANADTKTISRASASIKANADTTAISRASASTSTNAAAEAPSQGLNKPSEANSFSGSTAEKLLLSIAPELGENAKSLLSALKNYGALLNPDMLKLAAELFGKLSAKDGVKLNASAAALMASKNLPVEAADIIKRYISGNLKFARLFSNLTKPTLAELKKTFETNELTKNLITLVKNGLSGSEMKSKLSSAHIKELADNLLFQELITKFSNTNSESVLYFQWPIFYSSGELPDTLEGEAYYPSNGSKKQGFALRLLLNPPFLGRLEIALNKFENDLWVHFGAEKDSIAPIRSIFSVLQKNLLKDDIKSVKLTISQIRLFDNFFCVQAPIKQAAIEAFGVDIKA